jgi:hypothetical protein
LKRRPVEDYAEGMGAGDRFPPVVIYRDGESGLLHAIWANARDGVSLTRADRRRAVEGRLGD